MLAKEIPHRARRIWLTAELVAGCFPAGDGPEEDSDLVLRAQHQRFAGQQIEHRAQGEELRRPDVVAGLGRLHEPDHAVEQVLLAAAGGCDSDGVEVGGAAGRAGGAAADQGADHGDGGAEREHPVRAPAGRDDPVDDLP